MTALLHFSEDPGIRVFVPHVARTAAETEPFVWAIDEAHAPSFWFPRDCPRACCWRTGAEPISLPSSLFAGSTRRVHAVEWDWLDRIRACRLFVYRFDARPFRSHLDDAGYWTTQEDVVPLSVDPAGDLLECHARADIELRLVSDLWPTFDAVIASGLPFSIIRKANARPRGGR